MKGLRECVDCGRLCYGRRCKRCHMRWMRTCPSRDAMAGNGQGPALHPPRDLKTGTELLASVWHQRPGPDPPRPGRYSP